MSDTLVALATAWCLWVGHGLGVIAGDAIADWIHGKR